MPPALQLLTSAAVVLIAAWATYVFALRQKNYDALIAAKLRHYEVLSPALNHIFRYRMRVGDYLDKTPEAVLDAKRTADEEFYTHSYLWGNAFRRAYREFMVDSFMLYVKPRALIRTDASDRIAPSAAGWAGYTGEPVDRKKAARAYAKLMEAIAADLPFVPTSGAGRPVMFFTRAANPRREIGETELQQLVQDEVRTRKMRGRRGSRVRGR